MLKLARETYIQSINNYCTFSVKDANLSTLVILKLGDGIKKLLSCCLVYTVALLRTAEANQQDTVSGVLRFNKLFYPGSA